jgi:hypothetical protein
VINQELVDTARLLVAAVQDSDGFSSEYLRKLIIHLVPQLLGEIDILANVAQASASRFELRGLTSEAPEEVVEVQEPVRKGKGGGKGKKKGKRKNRRR